MSSSTTRRPRKMNKDDAIAPRPMRCPWDEFERMTHFGPDRLRAAIVIRKGLPP